MLSMLENVKMGASQNTLPSNWKTLLYLSPIFLPVSIFIEEATTDFSKNTVDVCLYACAC